MAISQKTLQSFIEIYQEDISQKNYLGNINPNINLVFNVNKNSVEYFFDALNPDKDICISCVNLLMGVNSHEWIKDGWNELPNLDDYYFFGDLGEAFVLLNHKTQKIQAIFTGTSDVFDVADDFEQFVLYLIEIMKIHQQFTNKNQDNDDYEFWEDGDYYDEMQNFTNHTPLKINKAQIYHLFFG